MLERKTPHRGVDFPAAGGTPFRCVADGTVVAMEYSSILGWVTVVKHTRTPAEVLKRLKPVYSGYCHQDVKASLWVGEKVKRGDVLGHVGFQGRNGSSAHGEHLHLTMSHDPRGVFAGEVFDPLHFIEARAAKPAAKAKAKPAAQLVYVVKHNDTLWEIAKDHHTTVPALLAKNPAIKDPGLIYPGQEVKL